MAHKKGGGSTRNGRDSNAQRLGVKQGQLNQKTRQFLWRKTPVALQVTAWQLLLHVVTQLAKKNLNNCHRQRPKVSIKIIAASLYLTTARGHLDQ